jgi:hypothetical protein
MVWDGATPRLTSPKKITNKRRNKYPEAVSKGKSNLFLVDFIRVPLLERFQIFNSPEDKSTFYTASPGSWGH